MDETRTDREPTDGLMKIKEWEDTLYYRVGCDCTHPDHDMSIWAETFGEHQHYEIRMGTTMCASSYRSRFRSRWLRWLDGPVNRVAIAARMLITGRVEITHEFVLGKENVRGFRKALQEIEEKFQ
jgi:hypothetical protein